LRRLRALSLTVLLHLLQPAARVLGRLRNGLSPLRLRSAPGRPALPLPKNLQLWSERWRPAEHWLSMVEAAIRELGAVGVPGGDWDRWDLEVRLGGMLAAARLRMAIEEHGAGKQLLRFRVWPRYSRVGVAATALGATLAGLAAWQGAAVAAVALGSVALSLLVRTLQKSAAAITAVVRAVEHVQTRALEMPAKPVGQEAVKARMATVGEGA